MYTQPNDLRQSFGVVAALAYRTWWWEWFAKMALQPKRQRVESASRDWLRGCGIPGSHGRTL
jgi:hypothetical protein